VDIGFSIIFGVGLLLAAFTATGVLSDEVENRTALTVVSEIGTRAVAAKQRDTPSRDEPSRDAYRYIYPAGRRHAADTQPTECGRAVPSADALA